MMNRIMLMVMGLLMFTGSALAAVEVNSADQAALDSIAGVGPATSRAIIAEREKNGNFRDWSDLEQRVKGIGGRNIVKLSAAGLVVNGKPYVVSGAAKPEGAGTQGGVLKANAPSAAKGTPQPLPQPGQ